MFPRDGIFFDVFNRKRRACGDTTTMLSHSEFRSGSSLAEK
jgi:hypothetical protein